MGDSWNHAIQVEKSPPAEVGVRYPRCTDGARACPPKDYGGSWGYGDMLEAIKDPKHEQRDEMLEWLGDDFDPEVFDADQVSKALAKSWAARQLVVGGPAGPAPCRSAGGSPARRPAQASRPHYPSRSPLLKKWSNCSCIASPDFR